MSTRIPTLLAKIDSLPNRENADIILDFYKYMQDKGSFGLKRSKHPPSNAIEYQKAHTFLEALVLLAYAPPSINELQLMFHLDKKFYNEMGGSQFYTPLNDTSLVDQVL
jgi:hypothetical protein